MSVGAGKYAEAYRHRAPVCVAAKIDQGERSRGVLQRDAGAGVVRDSVDRELFNPLWAACAQKHRKKVCQLEQIRCHAAPGGC
jgi:hypothetical protein